MVDAVAAQVGLVRGPEDETRISVATRDEDGVSRLWVVVAGWKGASCPLAVHVDPTELGMVLALDEVVADFVDKRQWFAKDLLECHRELLDHGKAIHDGEVPAGCRRVQIIAVVL